MPFPNGNPKKLSAMFSQMQASDGSSNESTGSSEAILGGAPEEREKVQRKNSLLLKKLDRYGFLIGDESAQAGSHGAVSLARTRQSVVTQQETAQQRKKRVRLENLRFEKWFKMCASEGALERERKQHPQRFKRRVRKGIPDAFRQKLWPSLCRADVSQKRHPGEYLNLFQKSLKVPSLEKVHESISRDVGRTFPRHVIFCQVNGIGQKSLGNILRAYSAVDQEVGYCQGMGFIVGLLLGYLGEEESFWVLRTLMQEPPWKLAELYRPGMRGAQLLLFQFEALLAYFLPDVSSHLKRECIEPSMYATQWFITIFAYNFPFDIVVRVWDVFLHEGWKIVFRVAVTIIKQNRREILARSMEQILEYFRGIPPRLHAEVLMDEAFKLKLTTAHLKKIEKDFLNQHQGTKT